MTVGFVFWLIMLLWLILGVVGALRAAPVNGWSTGSDLLLFILFCLVGWKLFGTPIAK